MSEVVHRIGIISDTHGYLNRIDEVLAHTRSMGLRLWLHAGDYGDDARYMMERTRVPVVAVRGNNDRVQPLEPREQLIPFEDTYIYMTHGDRIRPYNRVQEMITLARGMGATLAIAGHSHHHGSFDAGDCLFINPGSPSLPRDGSGGTFAVAEYVDGHFKVKFYYLRDL
nr:YfcE family phosphodiesterase [Veillonella magna]